MNKEIAYLELDVHKNTITLALLIGQRKVKIFIRKMSHNIKVLLRTVKQLSVYSIQDRRLLFPIRKVQYLPE